MSLYLRVVIGPIVLCDLEMFATKPAARPDDAAPQLNGGQGAVIDPWVDSGAVVFGFGSASRPQA